MSVCPENAPELQFPQMVHFKIIAVDDPDLRAHLEIALCELSIHDEIVAGRNSAAGKYITYNLSLSVYSRERMKEIDERLRVVPGVKMIL
jgi:putative lipoic acid-binding regulatory protein